MIRFSNMPADYKQTSDIVITFNYDAWYKSLDYFGPVVMISVSISVSAQWYKKQISRLCRALYVLIDRIWLRLTEIWYDYVTVP